MSAETPEQPEGGKYANREQALEALKQVKEAQGDPFQDPIFQRWVAAEADRAKDDQNTRIFSFAVAALLTQAGFAVEARKISDEALKLNPLDQDPRGLLNLREHHKNLFDLAVEGAAMKEIQEQIKKQD